MDFVLTLLTILLIASAVWLVWYVIANVIGTPIWIQAQQRGIAVRGAEVWELAPGKHRIRFHTEVQKLDMRTQPVHIPAQEIPTNEGVHARYGIVVEFAIVDAKAYVLNAQNALANVYRGVQLATRDVITALACDDVRARPAEIGEEIRKAASN